MAIPSSESSLPESAECVFQGEIFDVYQWPQTLFDGSVVTFERIKRPDTVSVIAVTPEKKILMLSQQQPDTEVFLSLPGGRVDAGETPEAAIQRELLEETGYQAHAWRLWNVVRPSAKLDWAIHTFIATGCTKKAEPHLDPGERITSSLVSFDEFLELVSHESFRDSNLALTILRLERQQRLAELKNLLQES